MHVIAHLFPNPTNTVHTLSRRMSCPESLLTSLSSKKKNAVTKLAVDTRYSDDVCGRDEETPTTVIILLGEGEEDCDSRSVSFDNNEDSDHDLGFDEPRLSEELINCLVDANEHKGTIEKWVDESVGHSLQRSEVTER